ncbi:POL5 [Candida margitis]|uniref:POL5 n=1 Tax=Candida margitis TaxID=1775924 RepID=UPI002227FB4A|nr:POL5 [Candida margitis]KAI5961073.1 POL5 [Candida margitis]
MVKRDHFSKLASENAKDRVQAANALMQELIKEDSPEEWDYTYNRLIKGLTSTRQTAKLGFGMLLTEVVSELKGRGEMTVNKYLDKLNEVTAVKSGMKGKEERALLFGRLFGLNVVIKVGWLEKASEAEWVPFIDALIDLMATKPWIREAAAASLVGVIKTANSNSKIANTVYLKVLQKLNDLGLNLSTEGLAVYLAIDRDVRSTLAQKIVNPKSNWKNGDPLHKGNLPILAKVLKDVEVIDEDSEDRKQKSNWNPQLPFVWDILIDDFVSGSNKVKEPAKKKHKTKNSSSKDRNEDVIGLKEFYKVVVDESLFSEKSSHERKYWGFEIFIKFLGKLDHDLDFLFTPNFMRCLINQSSHKSRTLHDIAVKVLLAITEKGSYSEKVAPTLLKCLLNESNGGCWNFDLVTKSRTVDGILSTSNSENIVVVISKFTDMLQDQNVTDGFKYSNDNVLKWCLDKLVHLVKFNREDDTVVQRIIELLIRYAFFESDVSPNIRKLAQEKLNSILSEVLSRDSGSTASWPRYCVDQIMSLQKTNKCLVEFDEELAAVRDATSDILQSSGDSSGSSSGNDFHDVFELLFSMCFIQLYMGDEEIVQITHELISLYENQVDKSQKDDDNDNVDTALVMTEILLSFITRKSTLLKRLSMIVWDHFLCGTDDKGQLRINDECFGLLFDVLKTKENKEGQKQLFENDDEMVVDGEDEEEEDDKEEEREDNNEEDEEDDDDDDDNDEDDDDDDDGDETANNTMTDVDKETNLKLAKALGIPTAESGEVKFDELSDLDSSNDEYESDSMDDEQMMAMDDQLSKIFKERQDILSSVSSGNKRKTEVHEARVNMIFFKNRVLDLLESFTRHHPNSIYNLKFIDPVVNLINLTLDKNLGVKAHKFLKTRISKTKVYTVDGPTSIKNVPDFTQWAKEMVKNLQHQAATTKSSNQAVISSYNQSCIVLAKNLIGVDHSQLESAFAIAAQALRNSLKPEFKAAVERRGVVEAKVSVFENGNAGEPRELKPIDK